MAEKPGLVPTDPFNRKVMAHLGDRVILKPLTRWNEAYKEFPRYVMEYLVSRYVQAEDPVGGQGKIDRILAEHYTDSAKKELIKSRIKENGEYTLLGQLSVRLDQGRDHYFADVPALGELSKALAKEDSAVEVALREFVEDARNPARRKLGLLGLGAIDAIPAPAPCHVPGFIRRVPHARTPARI